MSNPATPFYISSWGIEQAQIQANLQDLHTPPPSPEGKFNDGLGDVISQVGGHLYAIQADHYHIKRAMDIIENYPFPTSLEHFCQMFHFREWDIVCETMLVAIRLGELVPNAFQQFMLGVFIHEHAPICCCKCGLTLGYWCGKC